MSFSVTNYTWPAFQGRTPFDHQRQTVSFELQNKRGFILNDMGTGKTLSAMWAADILMHAQKLRRVLIIGPLSTMRSVWYNEWQLNIPTRRVGIAHNTNREKRLAILQNAAYEIVIINHDGIKNMEDEIIRQDFDLIIIDELTAYKANSERTKCMKRIADRCRAVWGMTGDMTPNNPTEAFWQCQIVNPFNKFLPRYFGQFRDACMKQVNEYVWVAKPEAPQIVAMCAQPAIRFTRAQCLDLPDTTYHTLETELTPVQLQYYEAMKQESYIEFESGGISGVNAGVKLNKLLQISAGAVKNDEGTVIEIGCKPRLDMLAEIFDQTPNKKLVVFATYRATIELIVKDMTKRGIKVATIHGDVNQNLRATHIDNFQRSDLEMLVIQPQSAAHGITLTAACDLVWFSLIPSNELFQQGIARIVRAGQKMKTMIHMFVSTPAEKRIAKILETKGDLSKETLALFADHGL